MEKEKREFDILKKEERVKAIEDIIAHFATERDEEMDIIGAGALLDAFLQDIAPIIYNKAIEDVRMLLKKQADDAEFELNLLRK